MLKIENLSKKLGKFELKDVNLDIENGEYFIILGPTGNGKTVLLELIAGMYRSDRGKVWFGDREISTFSPEERSIGFVYQDYALFPHLNIKENIVFGLKARGVDKSETKRRLDDIVSLLNIEYLLERFPSTLSGGEKQRTAIARALVTSPRILLLDEPLSALDARTKQLFQDELQRIHSALKTTTLHITHDFSEAMALGDRVGIMFEGEIVQMGKPVDVFRHPNSRIVADFVGAENIIEGNARNNQVETGEGIVLKTLSEKEGKVTLTIRPEDLILSTREFDSSAQNTLPGKITKMVNQGPLFRIIVDVGVILTALVSAQSVETMKFKPGDSIWVTFKSTAVNVL